MEWIGVTVLVIATADLEPRMSRSVRWHGSQLCYSSLKMKKMQTVDFHHLWLMKLCTINSPYHGAVRFKQYNPKKPVKYGLLYHSIYDSSVSYTYFMLPYARKPQVTTGDASIEHHLTITGTMHLYCKSVPKEMKLLSGREQKFTLHAYHNKNHMMMLSCINKKKLGKKDIVVLTTLHYKVKVTSPWFGGGES